MPHQATQRQKPPTRSPTSVGAKALAGAVRGAAAGLFVLLAVALYGPIEMVFHASFWQLETLWIALAVLTSTVVAGAFLGACLGVFPDYPLLVVPLLPIAGLLAGVVYWSLRRPNIGILGSALCGVGFIVSVAVMAVFESFMSRRRPAPETAQPETAPTGPPRECPRCRQATRNPDFCDICGKDLRSDPPPLVMPGG